MGSCPDGGSRQPGVGNQWDQFLSRDLGLFIMEVLLGRSDCGFSSLVQSFCEGREETMARGEREQKTSIFPLPLPSNTSVRTAMEKRDGLSLWFFLLVCALNYLNGGVHVRMGTFEANAIQQEILDYLKSRVDIYQEHEFEIGRFDWGKFLQTRTISYTNEEVRTAQWTSWSHVQPALPYGAVGSVRAVDYAEDGVLDLLLNPAQYLQGNRDHQPVRSSRVMVTEENWAELAEGLVRYNVCSVIPVSAVAKCGGSLLQNGLFGIEKNEQVNGVEVHRLIMNLVPFNSVSMHVSGDVATLPLLQQLASLHLQPEEELVVSSEDVRCMFYIFQLPAEWLPFLSFGKKAPPQLVPPHVREDCYLCAKVLPMGYLNSVGIAQHLHRNFMKKVQGEPGRLGPFSEIRKDRSWPLSNPCWRIYLDNLDVLEKTNPALCRILEGETSPDLAHIIQAYETAGIPLHAKKSVQQATTAEMQGAEIDGVQGLGQPRKEKLGKYVSAVLSLIRRARCSQKEIQVVGGGLVYFAMFRRPLMSCLNFIWGFIQSFEDGGPRVRAIPGAVLSELLMFISLLPLAHMDFRVNISPTVTASDASLLGGGVCASDQVTSYGEQVAEGRFRGEIRREVPDGGIVCVGLFDGISALRVALEAVQAHVVLHVSVEPDECAKRVVEANFPSVVQVDTVEEVSPELCREWAGKASTAKLVIVGAGPPCQGVSRLNADRKGAIEDERSCLHVLVKPIVSMLQDAFSWCQVRFVQESVASMDLDDRIAYTRQADVIPYRICASQLSPCRRDRLYWFDWTLEHEEGVFLYPPNSGNPEGFGRVEFESMLGTVGVLKPGWQLHHRATHLTTFTTSQPSAIPRSKPAGLHKCNDEALQRWRSDRFRFPPYQYKDENLVWNPKLGGRTPNVSERERALGFPIGYTANVYPKAQLKSHPQQSEDTRLSLLGNTWSIAVVAFLLLQLLRPLKLCLLNSLCELLETLYGDKPVFSESLLSWHGLSRPKGCPDKEVPLKLVHKLMTLLSGKGTDVMIQLGTEPRQHQRFRRSIPAQLWRWKDICSWGWPPEENDHINRYELRAIYTALRWRVLRRKECRVRFIHLTDSMVCLHVISKGRSSSHKLQSLLYRISSLLLAAGLHPLLAYVSTHTNPADRPSRRIRVKRRWGK